MKYEIQDALVIGAGPKGLSTQIALEGRDLASDIYDKQKPGHTWDPVHMYQAYPPPLVGYEITDDPNYRTEVWRNGPGQNVSLPERPDGKFTTGHMYEYLRYIGSELGVNAGDIYEVRPVTREIIEIDYVNALGQQVTKRTRSVVIATGLIGYGGNEFMSDPTGICGISDKVLHTPVHFREERETLEFLESARSVAMVGSGVSASVMFYHLQKASQIKQIILISHADRLVVDDESQYQVSPGGVHLVSTVRPKVADIIKNDSRLQQLYRAEVVQGRDMGSCIELDISQEGNKETISIDRVILGTGFRPNIAQIPFMRRAMRQLGIKAVGGLPSVTQDHEIISDDLSSTGLYVIGALAGLLGPEQRWLNSTGQSAQKIAESIAREVNRGIV